MMLVLILLCTFHHILAQSEFTSSPSDIISLIDGNATFRCSVGNFEPGDILQWYRDGSQEFITNGATVLSSSFDQRAYIEGGNNAFMLGQYNLIISRLQASDQDNYRCTYTKAGSLMVTGTTPASLTVLNGPTCSQEPSSVEIGQQVVLTCALNNQDVNKNVVTQVQWKFKNNIIASDPITTTAQRTIFGDDNYQEFVCEMVVTAFPNIIQSCSLLPLSIDPSASISPTGTYISIKGQTIEFTCSSTAYPHTASIDWLISGQSIYNFDDVFNFELSTDRMSFTMTVISDGGEIHRAYQVQCRVYDPQGYTGDSEMTTIVVKPYMSTTPSPTTTTIPTVPLSVFVQTPSDVTTTLGSVVVLHCAVNYLGDGVMKWFDVQKLVYIVEGLDVTSTSDDIRNRYSILGGREAYENGRYSLQIANAKVTDSGMYFCSYSSPLNSIYFSSDSANIEILSTSLIPPTTKSVVQSTTVPSTTYVTLPKSPSKSTTVQTTPIKRTRVYFIRTPSDTNTTAGSVVVLQCAVNNLGVGEMKWFKVESGRYIMVGLQVSISASDDIKNRYSIVGGNDAYSRGEYSLQIIDVKDTDSGTYFCSYSSPDATSISSGYAKLMLLGALVCQQTPDHALPSGAMVTMQCMVKDPNERTYVTWESDIGIKLTIPAINSVTYSVVLQPTDNFRSFTCSDVTSKAGDFARACSLTPLAIQPVVKIIEGASKASGGISVNFTCQAEAEPYVSSYEWLIDGMPLDTLNETFEFNTENKEEFLELTPIFNGENDATYNITCTVYIPSGHSTTSNGVPLLVTDRSFSTLPSTDTDALTVVTLVVISLLAVIVGIVFLLLCFLLLCHGRRRKLSLARKISFNHRTISGGRYGARKSEDDRHIDGYGSTVDSIYASPLQIRNGKKGITEKKAAKAVRQSIYENSAAEQRPNSISSEYMNYDHDQVFYEQNGVQPVGFSNFGYCPESPTSLRFNFSTLPTKPTVAPKPLTKRLSSFEPLPDVCSSRPNDYIDIRKLENEQNHKVDETGPDELIYSNEAVHATQSKSNEVYDDFDSDSFDSDSEDETYM